MEPEERRKIYGRTYTKQDENYENFISTVRKIGVVIALGLATQAWYATSEAGRKLDDVKEVFKTASVPQNKKALEIILNKRDQIVKQYGCLPQTWTKNHDNTFYFSDTVCFKYSPK